MFAIKESEPYLYILMRSDMESLNPGKMVAQGAHAANYFAFQTARMVDEITAVDAGEVNLIETYVEKIRRHIRLFKQWETSTNQGFGVTICLDVDGDSLPLVVTAASDMGMVAGIVHDPSYPLMDGKVLHLLPLNTCGFVFGDKPKLEALLGRFNLLA